MTECSIERWQAPGNRGERYHSAVRHRGVIYVSGQVGARSGQPPRAFAVQLVRALASLFEAVEALGGDRGSILKVNGYLARLTDFPEYHAVYAHAFAGAPLPARTTVQIAGFKPPILVELDATAASLRAVSSDPSRGTRKPEEEQRHDR